MRQLAWLDTVPRAKDREQPQSRRDGIDRLWDEKGAWETELPEIGDGQSVLRLFLDSGRYLASDYGAKPLTWQEIDSWIRITGTPVTYWEAESIHVLSGEYAAMTNAALDPDCPAPFVTEETKQKQQLSMLAGLRGIAVKR